MTKQKFLKNFWVVLTCAYSCCSTPAYSQDPLRLPALKQTWYQYFSAGEQALKKQDQALAKRYWIAALDDLDKANVSAKNGDVFFSVRMSVLEQRLTEMYQADVNALTKSQTSPGTEKEISLRQEQAGVLERIARLNKRFINPTNILVGKSQERADTARKELDKAVAASKQQTSQTSSKTSK